MKYIAIFLIVIVMLPFIFKLLIKLRLIFPLVYIALVSTVFVQWTEANQALSMTILYILLGLVALSWLITLWLKIYEKRQYKQYVKAKLYGGTIKQL